MRLSDTFPDYLLAYKDLNSSRIEGYSHLCLGGTGFTSDVFGRTKSCCEGCSACLSLNRFKSSSKSRDNFINANGCYLSSFGLRLLWEADWKETCSCFSQVPYY